MGKIIIPIAAYKFIKDKMTSFVLERIGHAADTIMDNSLDTRNTLKKEYEMYVRHEVSELSDKIENLEAVVTQSLRVYDMFFNEIDKRMQYGSDVTIIINGNVEFKDQVIIQNSKEMSVMMNSKNHVSSLIESSMSDLFIYKQDETADSILEEYSEDEENVEIVKRSSQNLSILTYAKNKDFEAEEKIKKIRREGNE